MHVLMKEMCVMFIYYTKKFICIKCILYIISTLCIYCNEHEQENTASLRSILLLVLYLYKFTYTNDNSVSIQLVFFYVFFLKYIFFVDIVANGIWASESISVY